MEYTTLPPFFNRGLSAFVRLLICIVLALALLFYDAHSRHLEGIRNAISVVLYPFQQLASAPSAMLERLGDILITRNMLREKNAQLETQNLQNAVTLQNYHALEAENAYLRDLLAMRARVASNPHNAIAAEIAYSDRDPFAHKIVIDKGEQDGVEAGRPVIDRVGLVGQVTRTYPWLAEVTLITNNTQNVPIQNLRSGVRAILAGTGNSDQLELRFIPLTADLQIGDQLVTSGIDGSYPPGLPVATVTKIERNPTSLFARVICKPLTGIDQNRQLLIVRWKAPAPDQSESDTKKETR